VAGIACGYYVVCGYYGCDGDSGSDVACIRSDHSLHTHSSLSFPHPTSFPLTPQPKTLAFYFKKVDIAVARALADNPTAEVVLLAHSIGGWIARAWLSEWAPEDVKTRVKKLVTLGSPHLPPPAGTTAAQVDQTRGLLTYVNANFPGAYESGVEYVSVIGAGVTGRVAWGAGGLARGVESLVAYSSYAVLSGSGEQAGDGECVRA
jgi:pimeloyl-ACP methyl ester carboxylesterase